MATAALDNKQRAVQTQEHEHEAQPPSSQRLARARPAPPSVAWQESLGTCRSDLSPGASPPPWLSAPNSNRLAWRAQPQCALPHPWRHTTPVAQGWRVPRPPTVLSVSPATLAALRCPPAPAAVQPCAAAAMATTGEARPQVTSPEEPEEQETQSTAQNAPTHLHAGPGQCRAPGPSGS